MNNRSFFSQRKTSTGFSHLGLLPGGSSVGYIPSCFSGISRINPLITRVKKAYWRFVGWSTKKHKGTPKWIVYNEQSHHNVSSLMVCMIEYDRIYLFFIAQMLHVWNSYLHLPQWWSSFVGNLTYLWKITIFIGNIHYKWPFSIAMIVITRG